MSLWVPWLVIVALFPRSVHGWVPPVLRWVAAIGCMWLALTCEYPGLYLAHHSTPPINVQQKVFAGPYEMGRVGAELLSAGALGALIVLRRNRSLDKKLVWCGLLLPGAVALVCWGATRALAPFPWRIDFLAVMWWAIATPLFIASWCSPGERVEGQGPQCHTRWRVYRPKRPYGAPLPLHWCTPGHRVKPSVPGRVSLPQVAGRRHHHRPGARRFRSQGLDSRSDGRA